MASLKAEKPVGSQLFGHAKKETSDGASKSSASKQPTRKAAPKPQEPKKKGKGAGKTSSKK